MTVSMQGDFGKPRPALIIQSDIFGKYLASTFTVLPVTSALVSAPLLRITVQPSPENGLQKPSQIMVDKIMTIKHTKVGSSFGRIDAHTLALVESYLATFLGITR
ncbi:Growth inhibitor [Bartonella ancashensis]|uniref:Growth inhibitor n=1 Tax=Bartonella ancashensis TaxID=1318743 RepID=A0A0M4M4Q3_9HYPH|nr:Growth inhibitor [Bartonella ancashensis]